MTFLFLLMVALLGGDAPQQQQQQQTPEAIVAALEEAARNEANATAFAALDRWVQASPTRECSVHHTWDKAERHCQVLLLDTGAGRRLVISRGPDLATAAGDALKAWQKK